MFPGSISEWTAPQKAMAHWLWYYDQFYEALAIEGHDCPVKSWMVEYDSIVDAFFVWKDWKDKEEAKERSKGPDEARPPKVSKSEYAEVYTAAFQ